MASLDVILDGGNQPEKDGYDDNDCDLRNPFRSSDLTGIGPQQAVETTTKFVTNEVRKSDKRTQEGLVALKEQIDRRFNDLIEILERSGAVPTED